MPDIMKFSVFQINYPHKKGTDKPLTFDPQD